MEEKTKKHIRRRRPYNKLEIGENCKGCRFSVHDVYMYHRCTIYDKLVSAFKIFEKPEWCKVKEIKYLED